MKRIDNSVYKIPPKCKHCLHYRETRDEEYIYVNITNPACVKCREEEEGKALLKG